MDVSFSNVLEGTRQYFQGLPKASSEDQPTGNYDMSAVPSQQPSSEQVQHSSSEDVMKGVPQAMANLQPLSNAIAGTPSPARPPPAPSEPPEPLRPPSEGLLEPKPHFIHKATVMQQAQKKQQESFLNPVQDLERPPSIHLISPPTHIIPKPPHALSSNSLDGSKSNRSTAHDNVRIPSQFSESSQYNVVSNNSHRDPINISNTSIPLAAGGYKTSHLPTPPQPSIQDMINYQNRNQQRLTTTARVQQSRQSTSTNFQHSYPSSLPTAEPRYPSSSQAPHHQVSEANSQYYYTNNKHVSNVLPGSHRAPQVSQLHNSQSANHPYPPYKMSAPTYSLQSNIVSCHRESPNARDHNVNHSSMQRSGLSALQPSSIPPNSRVPPIVPHTVLSQPSSHMKSTHYASVKPPDQSSYIANINQQPQRKHYAYDNSIQNVRKSDTREYTYSVHSNHYRTAAAASSTVHSSQQSMMGNRAPTYSDVKATTDRYQSNLSTAYSSSAKSQANVQQYLPPKSTHSSSLHSHEYHSMHKPTLMPTDSQVIKATSSHPAYRYASSAAPTAPNYTQGAVSASPAVHNGSHYHQPPYQVTSVVKQTYETPGKHGQPTKTSMNKSSCPSQRMTVSVQSLVNQMNVMRKQQSSKQDIVQTHAGQKKESPLDLSVKTLKIPADSTGQDDAENVAYDKRDAANRKHHILPLREPPVLSYAGHPGMVGNIATSTNSSHKVDFLPNFNSTYPETQHYESAQAQHRLQLSYHPEYTNSVNVGSRGKPVYPVNTDVHATNNLQSNVIKQNYSSYKRTDHSLPRIDFAAALGKDYNKEQINGSQPLYVREDSRKRSSNNPTSNIPEKIVRYETWTSNSRIEKHNINKDVNHVTHLPAKPLNGTLYDYNRFKHHDHFKSDKLTDYQVPSNTSTYPESHSNQYLGQYSSDAHKYVPRENGSRYLMDRQYISKNVGSKLPAATDNTDNLNSGSPADKRVLSILRNSLEVKSGIEPSRIIHNLDEPIVIDHDDPEPEINNFAAVKENLADKPIQSTVEPLPLQADPVARKLHMPKAVDSIRYDSDSKSSYYDDIHNDNSKHSDDHSNSIPTNSGKSTSEIDVAAVLAARIRTKAELKGFTLPQEKKEEKPPISEEKPISFDIATPTDCIGKEPVHRRLFSKDKSDGEKVGSDNICKPNNASVFDFEDSQPEDSEMREDIVKVVQIPEVVIKEEPMNDREFKCDTQNEENEIQELEDPFWAETCHDFIEQLKTGSGKKKVRKKTAEIESSAPITTVDLFNDSLVDYKIEKSVVVNVVDIIKSENSDIPYIMKIKEEFKEMENIKMEPESSDDDEPLINSKHIKTKHCSSTPNVSEDHDESVCPNVVIKVETDDTTPKKRDLPSADSADNQEHLKIKSKFKLKTRNINTNDDSGKQRKQNLEKRLNRNESSSDETDSDDNITVGNRLRTRKNAVGVKCDENKKKMTLRESPKKKEDKNLLKKPGFGDGSDFRPGWEEEVYRYKRSLRMPSRLINVTISPQWPRISSSLPDLDPSSPAPSSSTTDEIYSRQKYANSGCDTVEKCKDIDSDIESNYSFSANPKVGYDSEASCSTVFSFASKTAKKKESGSSILDLLIQKCGKKDDAKKKHKEEAVKPKIIPKSSNPLELLETPNLGMEKNLKVKKGDTPVKKETNVEHLFYLRSFRKKTVSTFRDAFINNTDGMLGATEEFAPVVLKSRTRTETRVLKQRATIKEVFGDERPASAPPSSCRGDDVLDPKCDEPKIVKLPVIKKIIKCGKKSIREGLRSSRILRKTDAKSRLLRHRKRNGLITTFKSKKLKMAAGDNSKIKKERCSRIDFKPIKEGESAIASPSNKKRFRKLFSRRKFSSGFDYIRKKKKIIKREDDTPKIIKRPVTKTTPESVHDIQKEIKGWIVNKSVGETTLHRAARLGYTDCVAYCLEKLDLPPSAKDNAGYTALHEASSRGHLQIAKILLQYGANVSEAAQGGIRPLHEACENEHIEVIRLLLSYGADPLLATYSGQTPVSLAEGETAKYLKLHIDDLEGTSAVPWHFEGPSKIFDPPENGCDVLTNPPPPSPSPPPPSPPIEICSAHQPLPPLYTLKPGLGERDSTGPWCLLSDLCNLLQVKSRDSLLKQIHSGPGSPRDALRELKMQDFIERAVCHQLLAAGEKINIRASKISLVKFTDKVKELLDIETTVIR